MKIIVFIYLFPILIYAQFTKNDSILVSTTFKREFNKQIISAYLNSPDTTKIKAALLSISHSSDTSFVPEIVKLNYSQNADIICFTLGQLGQCSASESFLLNKVNNDFISQSLLQALGKCGSKTSLDSLVSFYKEFPEKFNGISLALFSYNLRGITDSNKTFPVLLNELTNKRFPKERQVDAAFTICRSNFAMSFKNALVNEIKLEMRSGDNSEAAINKLYYLTGAIRSIKYFPNDKKLFNSLLKRKEEIIRIESAKALVYYPFKNKDELNSYLTFFNDINPNVTRTAAAALKEIKLNNSVNIFIKKWIHDKICKMTLSPHTGGELLNSYIRLFTPDFKYISGEFSRFINPQYIYGAAGQILTEDALNYITKNFQREFNRNKLVLLQSLLNFQNNFGDNSRLKTIMYKALNSDFTPLISIAADGMGSVFIKENKEMLSAIVVQQAGKYYNDPDFAEAMVSLANLAEKIDTSITIKVLNLLSQSTLFSLQKFVADKYGRPNLSQKDDKLFPVLWDKAFKYSYAEIETSKGKFKIRFLPEYAPISVGNFIYLSQKGFYNNVYFHRVVPAFVIQAGDTTATGWGGPGYEIISETSPLSYIKGMVGMASAGKDTEGSQWFVTTGYYPHLNGKYTIFAEVIDGMETVYKTDQDDQIISVKLLEK